jgi:hypothetical protein
MRNCIEHGAEGRAFHTGRYYFFLIQRSLLFDEIFPKRMIDYGLIIAAPCLLYLPFKVINNIRVKPDCNA